MYNYILGFLFSTCSDPLYSEVAMVQLRHMYAHYSTLQSMHTCILMCNISNRDALIKCPNWRGGIEMYASVYRMAKGVLNIKVSCPDLRGSTHNIIIFFPRSGCPGEHGISYHLLRTDPRLELGMRK